MYNSDLVASYHTLLSSKNFLEVDELLDYFLVHHHVIVATNLLLAMSFLDPYDIANTGTSTPPINPHPEKSLNDEVSQVMGQLGSWWGGFKRQVRDMLVISSKHPQPLK